MRPISRSLLRVSFMLPTMRLRWPITASTTPVLMLTGRDDEIDRVVGLEVGADDYLVKPFSMRELLARTRAMLRRFDLIQQSISGTPDREAAPLRYQALSLDPVTHTVRLEDEKLDLSRTEFDLLHLLMRHPGRVFARDELLDRVWQASFSGQDRAVDYAIHRLRRKLRSVGDFIETVHGVGYRFQSDK